AGEGVVDLVAGAIGGREKGGEVSVLLGGSRHRVGGGVVPWPGIAQAFVSPHEEWLVLAVVSLPNGHGAAERAAPDVIGESGVGRAGLIVEEVVGPEIGALEGISSRAVEIVGAGFQTDVSDAALRLSELRVESGGLHLKLLNDVGRRHVGSDHLVAV